MLVGDEVLLLLEADETNMGSNTVLNTVQAEVMDPGREHIVECEPSFGIINNPEENIQFYFSNALID